MAIFTDPFDTDDGIAIGEQLDLKDPTDWGHLGSHVDIGLEVTYSSGSVSVGSGTAYVAVEDGPNKAVITSGGSASVSSSDRNFVYLDAGGGSESFVGQADPHPPSDEALLIAVSQPSEVVPVNREPQPQRESIYSSLARADDGTPRPVQKLNGTNLSVDDAGVLNASGGSSGGGSVGTTRMLQYFVSPGDAETYVNRYGQPELGPKAPDAQNIFTDNSERQDTMAARYVPQDADSNLGAAYVFLSSIPSDGEETRLLELSPDLTWTEVRTSMPYQRDRVASVGDTNYIYIAGGRTEDANGNLVSTAATTRYNPDTDTFDPSGIPDLPAERESGAMAISIPNENNQLDSDPAPTIFYTGGARIDSNGSVNEKTTVYSWQAGDSSWSTLTGFSTARKAHAAGATADALVVTGGSGGGSFLRSTEVYDISAGTWSSGTNAPVDINFPASGVRETTLFVDENVVTGDPSDVYSYRIDQDTWRVTPYLTASRLGAMLVQEQSISRGATWSHIHLGNAPTGGNVAAGEYEVPTRLLPVWCHVDNPDSSLDLRLPAVAVDGSRVRVSVASGSANGATVSATPTDHDIELSSGEVSLSPGATETYVFDDQLATWWRD